MNEDVTISPQYRPLIGITTRLDIAQNTFYLRRYYAEAIVAAGGIPVYIPLLGESEALLEMSARLDGVLLSGSNSDLDPAHYGQEPRPTLGPVVEERDRADLLLLADAEVRKLPVLGICFGMQSLNVSRGGSLIQDLKSEVPGALKHEQDPPFDRTSHSIEIETNSLLARLVSGPGVRVNSTHHQAVREVGADLRVTARAADGVIEAVEDTRSDRFVLGVQWHPEFGWAKSEFSRAIFRSFVEAAGNGVQQR